MAVPRFLPDARLKPPYMTRKASAKAGATSSSSELDYNKAMLRLTHSSHPDPHPLLHHCRTGEQYGAHGSEPEQMLKSDSWGAVTTAYFLLV